MPTRALKLACALAACTAAFADDRSTAPNLSTKPRLGTTSSTRLDRGALGEVSGGECTSNSQCNDGLGCTADICSNKACLNIPIPDCVECQPTYACPPAEIVFIMDTSGSMRDEAAALCSGMQSLVNQLESEGVTVIPHFLGITTVGEGFTCLTDNVVNLLGGSVPGSQATCPFPNNTSAFESWGPATAIVAARFPWAQGAARFIVPISDEAPCNGSRPEGCQDPGPDRDSVANAADVAGSNGIIVSPIMGTGTDACAFGLANTIASLTGGQAFQSKSPLSDLIESVRYIATYNCALDDSCDDGHTCTDTDRCTDGVCIGTPIPGCRVCKTSSGCDDDNACTLDSCLNGVCSWSENYDADRDCCNPFDRLLTPLNDGDPCTLDVCDPSTGRVNHPPVLAGAPCDDEVDCTVHDSCDGNGVCAGVEVSDLHCADDEQCFGHTCNVESTFCVCGDTPTLCVELQPDSDLLGNCRQQNGEVVFNIELGNSSRIIVGGQFRVKFDPAVLQFLDAVPGSYSDPGSPFSIELMRAVDEVGGAVFYAVSTALGGQGTVGPATMATLRFRPLEACATDTPCFLDDNPQHTLLSDNRGHSVPFIACCNGTILVHGAPPTLACPGSVTTHADPGTISANITWNPPKAAGECEGPLPVNCQGTNSNGASVTHLLQHGGQVPAGVSHFECTAIDSCGAESACTWNVEVQESNAVQVNVQLSPLMSSGPVQRCIEFAFYSSCFEPPVVVEQTLTFGFPFNLPGRSDNVTFEIPPGQYSCASARDRKHTLRSTGPLQIQGHKFVANFLGDPALGGNWLRNGNLDGNGVIDSVDQAILLSAYSTSINRNTPCGTPGFHADINGDGAVNANDLMFVQRNYLATDMALCCPNVVAGAGDDAVTSFSLNAAQLMGLGDLSFADVNHDGVISSADVVAILRRDLKSTKPDSSPR